MRRPGLSGPGPAFSRACSPKSVEEELAEGAERRVYALYSESELKERNVDGFLDGLVRSTKAVMTRVELGGTLFLVVVIEVFLISRGEEGKSS
jgi:hypothetical protein